MISDRRWFDMIGYVGAIEGLLTAYSIFLSRCLASLGEEERRYGRYLARRLDLVEDRSWMYGGEDRERISRALSLLEKARDVIMHVIGGGDYDTRDVELLIRSMEGMCCELKLMALSVRAP